MNDMHSCSYFCDRPACIKAQRDELRAALAAQPADAGRDKLAARLDKVLSDRLDLKRSNEALAARVRALEADAARYRQLRRAAPTPSKGWWE